MATADPNPRDSLPPPRPWWRSPAFILVSIYSIISVVYLTTSDLIVEALVPDPLHPIVHTLKGSLFVLVTGAWLYWRITRSLKTERELAAEAARLATRHQRQLRTAEIKLGRIEKRYQALFDAFPQPTVVYDRQTRQILDANTAALQKYDYPKPDFLQLTASQLVAPPPSPAEHSKPRLPAQPKADPDKPNPNPNPAPLDGQPALHRSRTGQTFWVSQKISHVQYRLRPASLMVALDISAMVVARRRAATLRRRLKRGVAHRTRALERARASLESILTTMSYDLRGPLETLSTQAADLSRRIESGDTEQSHELAARLIGGLARTRHLVQELTLLGGDGPPQQDSVSLILLVTRVLGQLRRSIGDVTANVRVVEPLGAVTTSETIMAHVLASLLRAMLTRTAQPALRIYTQEVDGHLVLWIEDDAPLLPHDRPIPEPVRKAATALRPLVARVGGKLLTRPSATAATAGYRIGWWAPRISNNAQPPV
jgi:PAS domain-containing protein